MYHNILLIVRGKLFLRLDAAILNMTWPILSQQSNQRKRLRPHSEFTA